MCEFITIFDEPYLYEDVRAKSSPDEFIFEEELNNYIEEKERESL